MEGGGKSIAVEGLPEPIDGGTLYIVSVVVLTALKGSRVDVVCPDTGKTAVRDAEGKIQAVRQWIV